jgi:hypothetical protein
MKNGNRIRPRVEELESRLVPSRLVAHSTNWSGYAVSTADGAVSKVAGSWVVPAVSTSVSGYSSAWVGIDGWNSSSVEQIGTDSDYVNGHAQYYAWFEMYPLGSVNLSLTISPGDKISASVGYTGSSQFALSITDVTTGSSFSTTQTSSQAKQSSAEWIQEAPSSGGVLPLANFGTIQFSGASATVNGTAGPADTSWTGSTLNQVNMVTRTSALKATTSTLSDSGSPPTSSFTVTFVSSGSSGKGGGHKGPDAPPPTTSQSNELLAAAVAAQAASAQGTRPAFATPSFPVVPGVVALPTLPAASAVTATFAQSRVDDASPDGPEADRIDVPKTPVAPVPTGPAAPADSQAADDSATARAGQVPARLALSGLETIRATDACFAEGSWLAATSFDGTRGAASVDHKTGGLALTGLILTLALDRACRERPARTERKTEWRKRSDRIRMGDVLA